MGRARSESEVGSRVWPARASDLWPGRTQAERRSGRGRMGTQDVREVQAVGSCIHQSLVQR